MQKISPFLWFDHQAEEAARFYVSIFKDSRILNISHYGEGSRGQSGAVMTVEFQIEGQNFTALNGGPLFTFNSAISFFVRCTEQAEVDDLCQKLTQDGEQLPCGWLRDKFGLSWQIIPAILGELLADPDPVRSQQVMEAMLQMTKIDIAGLKRAHEGL